MGFRVIQPTAIEQITPEAALDLGRAGVGSDRLAEPLLGLGEIGLAAPELRHDQFGRIERRIVLERRVEFPEGSVVIRKEEVRPSQTLSQWGVPRIGFEQGDEVRTDRGEVAARLECRNQPHPRLALKDLLPFSVPARAVGVLQRLRAAQDGVADAAFVEREARVGEEDLRMGRVLRRRLLDENPRLLPLLDFDRPLRQDDFRRRQCRVGPCRCLERLDRVVEFAGTKRFPRLLLIGAGLGLFLAGFLGRFLGNLRGNRHRGERE